MIDKFVIMVMQHLGTGQVCSIWRLCSHSKLSFIFMIIL